MFVVVSLVALLVQIYSLGYMSEEKPAALGRYYTAHYLPYRGPDAWGRWRGLVASSLRATDRARVDRVRKVKGVIKVLRAKGKENLD